MSEKLVRDNIPFIALRSGQTVTFRQADPDERVKLLWAKLDEELGELFDATTDEEKVEEMADVIEVLAALAGRLTTLSTLDRVRSNKAHTNGLFDQGYVMQVGE